jgi:spore maturation protein CgeB
MRIGIAGPTGTDMFAAGICDGLRDLGHTVTALGPVRRQRRTRLARGLVELACEADQRRDLRSQWHLVRAARAASCELVVSVDARLHPAVVSQFKADGARVALWFPDALCNLGRAVMLLAPYDALFFKEPHLVDRVRAMLGLPAHYLPQAANPRLHRPCGPAGTGPCLVLAGNMYPSRTRLLERLADKGIPLALYGAPMSRWLADSPVAKLHAGRPVFGEEKARLFRSAAGVLNNLHPAEVSGVNTRLFEAAASGAAVLTEYRPTLPSLFTPGEEVLAFHDFDELVGQAQRLLAEPGLTQQLGDAAARRAHRDHTYANRLAVLLETMS